jgi:hypothetical protein
MSVSQNRRSENSICAVTNGEIDLAAYEKVDGVWRDLGLAAPARRALINAEIYNLKQLANWSKSDLKKLHGMGPNALAKLADFLTNEKR